MKHDNIDTVDEQLRSLLRDQAPDVRPNKWFTHRVLHRLPAHRAAWWMGHTLRVAALVMLAGCWLWMAGDISATRYITVADILQYAAVLAVTVYTLHTLFSSSSSPAS